MTASLRFLVAESEPFQAREERRASVGRSSGETYADVLCRLVPDARCERVFPADVDSVLPTGTALAGYDAVFLTGSPLHLYEDTPAVRRQIAFVRAVFEAGTPSFGSCAGLQVATVAAGGSVRPDEGRREAGFARRITRTPAGHDHPLLRGRPSCWDAPTIHTDEVETLPPGGVLLAVNRGEAVQAAAIRCGPGLFWGVQYHPELSLAETAGALRREADDLLARGLVRTRADLAAHADLVEALGREPDRADLLWRLGLDEQVAKPERRQTELRNFVEHLAVPTRAARDRSGADPRPRAADVDDAA